MGKNKRRRKGGNRGDSGGGDDEDGGGGEGIIVYQLEDVSASASTSDEHLPEWSIDYVRNINTTVADLTATRSEAPTLKEVSECMVKGTLHRIQSKRNKTKRNNESTPNATTVTPTPIQLRMWPAMLNSFHSQENNEFSSTHNIHGFASTGTGKTLASVLPIVTHCVWRQLLCNRQNDYNDGQPNNVGVFVHGLVLACTRELAIQISKEVKLVAKIANKILSKCKQTHQTCVEAVAIYGGVDAESQISSFSLDSQSRDGETPIRKFLIVAATPGRLQDLLNKDDKVTLSAFDNLQTVVFDEADRMAMNPEMASQVDDILDILSKQREQKRIVSCLVSATLPEKALEICDRWVPRSRFVIKIDSVKVKIGKEAPSTQDAIATNNEGEGNSSPKNEEAATTRNSNSNIDLSSIPSHLVQTCHVCSNHKKPKKLILTLSRLYKTNAKSSGRFTTNNRLSIVFFAQIKTVKYVSKLLQKEGLRCVELYGSLHQTEREKRLLDFRAGKIPILLATDVAARGIHINNVHYVVNYDFPSSLDQYVHRCGRAGRKQLLSGEDVSNNPPVVYSFFTREFSAMADSLIELLRSCNATVDPNLLELSSSNKPDTKSTKRRKRKSAAMSDPENKASVDAAVAAEEEESDKDDFQFLGKSVLKRASHVSDASSDSDSE